MKKLFLLVVMVLSIYANEWKVQNIMLITENDADFRTDRDYTYGSEIGVLYKTGTNHYISFSIAHQMFTPSDIEAENIDFTKERPYAGYMYLSGAQHTTTANTLTSINIQVGFVGPSVKMDKVQELIHSIIGSPDPKGWEEQLKDELILQLNLERRYIADIALLQNFNENIIYYGGIDLGNASTKATAGAIYTIGNTKLDNFGIRRIDYRGYNTIPNENYNLSCKHKYQLFFTLEGNVVARNIFLDGNTFKDSVHVDKEIFVLKGGFGLSYSYDHLRLAYLHTFSTKEFKTQEYYHGYGSFYIGYNF